MIRTVQTRQQRMIAVCGKCSAKLGGGFGPDGKTSLTKALRKSEAIGKGKRAPVRLIETRCLKLCPKHAVAVIDAREPDKVAIVPGGTPVDGVLAHLGLTASSGEITLDSRHPREGGDDGSSLTSATPG